MTYRDDDAEYQDRADLSDSTFRVGRREREGEGSSMCIGFQKKREETVTLIRVPVTFVVC